MRSHIMNAIGTLLVTAASCIPLGLGVLAWEHFSWNLVWVKFLGALVVLWLALAQAFCFYALPIALADIWKPLHASKRLAR